MPKKSVKFENKDSKRRVTLQFRGYDSNGKYEGVSENTPNTINIKNVTESEVFNIVENVLKKNFGDALNDQFVGLCDRV